MGQAKSARDRPRVAEQGPAWHHALRAVREAQGLTQDGWAVRLGVSRKTVQRWERGEAVPDARAEAAILGSCHDRGLFRSADRWPSAGLAPTAESLSDLLAAGRLKSRPYPRVGSGAVAGDNAAAGTTAVNPVVLLHNASSAAESLARRGLPIPLTSLVGRRLELAALRGALVATRLLTCTGPGGVGKTRLALQVAADVAADFTDGVAVVPLAPIRDPALVAATIAEALDVRQTASRSPRDSLIAALRNRHQLLLLDNFEQVVSAAPLMTDLLTACPQLTLLVTSRAALRLRGEQEFPVPPLALPDPERLSSLDALARNGSVALFIQRARAVRPDFVLTWENAQAVAQICVRLDGLPLAIELAAVRIKLLPPRALLAQLHNRLHLLTVGARDLPPRQQTLRSTIDWSHDLLPPGEQALFRRLSVFVGGCTLEAAAEVTGNSGQGTADAGGGDGRRSPAARPAGPAPHTPYPPSAEGTTLGPQSCALLEELAALADQNLLQQTELGDPEPRFVMLETIREYALERLEASEEAEALRGRHAAYFVLLAERAEPALHGAGQMSWLERLTREHDNLRAALQWLLDRGQTEMALRLSGALSGLWDAHSHLSEGREWLARALATGAGRPGARIKALNWASYFACLQGDYVDAQAQAEQGLALCRERGSRGGIGYALLILGQVATERGEEDEAVRLWSESLQALREAGDRWGMARPLNNLGELARARGDLAQARVLHEEALALCRELGDTTSLPNVLRNLGHVMWRQGEVQTARALAGEALALSRDVGNKLTIATALEVAALAWALDRPERAARLWGAAEAIRDAICAPWRASTARLVSPQ